MIGIKLSSKIDQEIYKLLSDPKDIIQLEKVERLVRASKRLPMSLNIWRSQNIVFAIGKQYCQAIRENSDKGDKDSAIWLTAFDSLSKQLGIEV